MREVKFRAWDFVREEWITEGDLIMTSNGQVFVGDEANPPMVRIPLINVSFYTGVEDKNGTEIYEGDKVLYYRNNPNSAVTFRNGSFCLDTNGFCDYFNELEGELEVVGNIWEESAWQNN